MRKLGLILAFITGALFLGSCEGPTGPEGRPGPTTYPYVLDTKLSFDGQLDDNLVGQLVKNPVEVLDGDMVLAYIMTDNTDDGKPVWKPMPNRFFVMNLQTEKEEELEYSYSFTIYDVEIVAAASTSLRLFNGDGSENTGFLKNMIFRLVYVPASNPVTTFKSVDGEKARTPLSYEEAVVKYNLQNVKVDKQY